MSDKPVDTKTRETALDPTQSFIVAAPAGSGKTGLITERLLCLLNEVDYPEEILCITFTRKAAAEMASRVHSALQHAHTEPCPLDPYGEKIWCLARQVLVRNQANNWSLLELPGRLRIQTIDGFSRYIANQFALETTVQQIPEPTDQALVYYRNAARNLLDHLEDDTPTGEYLGVLIAHMGNNMQSCESLLSTLLEKREQWLPLIFAAADDHDYFQEVIDRLIATRLEYLAKLLQPIASELVAITDIAATNVDYEKNPQLSTLQGISELPLAQREHLADWQGLITQFLTKKLQWRSTLTAREGFLTGRNEHKTRMLELISWGKQAPAVLDEMVQVSHLPHAPIAPTQQILLESLAYLLPRLVAELNLLFDADNKTDYAAITLSALEATASVEHASTVSDITLRLDYQLKHILVDEFQDTSVAQIRLLQSVISGWEPNDGRTLFLVGDSMQSLYSFRNAKVGLFIRAQQQPIGPIACRALTLNTNFRSSQIIVDWVNRYFSEAFPAVDDIGRGAVKYTSSEAFKKHDGASVKFFGYCGENFASYEARRITELCVDLQKNKPRESIAILVRSRTHLRAIIPAMDSANVLWDATDIDTLATTCMPVIDMLSLTRALMSASDRTAWLAVLRAPFCGFDLGDLLTLTSQSSHEGVSNKHVIIDQLLQSFDAVQHGQVLGLTLAGMAILKRVAPVLKAAWVTRMRTDLAAAVEHCWLQLGGSATLASESDHKNIKRYLALLSDHQVAGTIPDWETFNVAVEKLYAAPPDISSVAHSLATVRIMTIHRAKGLEFDHVLLPNLSKSTRSSDKPLLRWQEHVGESENDLVMATISAYDDEEDSVYGYLQHAEAESSRLENTRVLYVAATRAVKGLYLFGALKQRSEKWQPPATNSLLAPIWPTLQQDIDNGQYQVMVDANSVETLLTEQSDLSVRRLPHDIKLPAEGTGGIITGGAARASIHSRTDSEDLLIENDSARARSLGNILHRALKQIAKDGLSAWPLERLTTLDCGWRNQLKEAGLLVTPRELSDLQKALCNTLTDSRGRWILEGHRSMHAELAIDYHLADDNGIQRSIVDLAFEDQGTRWIIDYKYTYFNKTKSVESITQRLQHRYSQQLRHYAQLFERIENKPVRLGLYLPRIPFFIEIPRI